MENNQKRHDDPLKNQHNTLVRLFDTDYAALCSFHKTAYAVLLKKQHNNHVRSIVYTLYCIMRNFSRNSMMT